MHKMSLGCFQFSWWHRPGHENNEVMQDSICSSLYLFKHGPTLNVQIKISLILSIHYLFNQSLLMTFWVPSTKIVSERATVPVLVLKPILKSYLTVTYVGMLTANKTIFYWNVWPYLTLFCLPLEFGCRSFLIIEETEWIS